jgi:hypothetical protein
VKRGAGDRCRVHCHEDAVAGARPRINRLAQDSQGVDLPDGKKRYPQHIDAPQLGQKSMLPPRRFEDVSADWKTWTCVMSHHDSTQWRARAKETRILAEKMKGEISKHLMLRIAEDYERSSTGQTALRPR